MEWKKTVRRVAEDILLVASTLYQVRYIFEMQFWKLFIKNIKEESNFSFDAHITEDKERKCVRLTYKMSERTKGLTSAMKMRNLKSVFLFYAVGLSIRITWITHARYAWETDRELVIFIETICEAMKEKQFRIHN